MASVEEYRRLVFIGGTEREFVQLCSERRVPPATQIFVRDLRQAHGRCFCESCVEIIWGVTAPIEPALLEYIRQMIAMGHHGG